MNHAALKAIVFAGLIATQVNIISAQARTLSTSANWTWMKGASITNQIGTYGTQGVADPANTPGARAGAVSWINGSGALWLFGGRGYAVSGGDSPLNDLWKYDLTTKNWIWIKGANSNNQYGIYGTQGMADPANTPGARYGAISWTDSAGKLWLFGGRGYSANFGGYLNDLWKYDPATTNWTWMKGSTNCNQFSIYGTQGVPDHANAPGSRDYAVSWIDSSGALWLCGGYGGAALTVGYLNDLWKYDPATTNWTWMKGSTNSDQYGHYGTQGVADPTNTPGGRYVAVSWIDNAGALWLFSGCGCASLTFGYLNDLWKYDPATTNWTWMKGSTNSDQYGTYGTQGVADPTNMPGARYVAMSWMDSVGALWLFGGRGYASTGSLGELNDLWKYNPATTNWTWMKGVNITNQLGTYGTQGKADPANMPGARNGAVSWTDSTGALWLFGGGYYDNIGIWVELNDLWKYDLVANPINDYDGDGKSDLAVFRDGYWSIYLIAGSILCDNVPLWAGTDYIPVPGDYDGDRKADLAVFRDGYWSIYLMTGNILCDSAPLWVGTDYIPVPGDYDGDGKSDLAVFRDGYWSIYLMTGSVIEHSLGGAGWTPVPGDYDGDGKSDLAVFHDGYWSIYLMSGSTLCEDVPLWVGTDYIPVSGDYDGDGKSDLAVFRDGYWSIYLMTGNILCDSALLWVGTDYIPVPGDYDGDGKSDLAVYRAGYWSIYTMAGSVLCENMPLWVGPDYIPVR